MMHFWPSYLHLCVLVNAALVACSSIIAFEEEDGLLKLATAGGPGVKILCAPEDDDGVIRVAKDLALDFGRVLGTNGTVLYPNQTSSSSSDDDETGAGYIIIGTIGHSSLIDDLVDADALDVGAIRGKWESYTHAVVDSPAAGVSRALVIAGSDKRGAVYGAYSVSETIGVSPWHYWASIPSKKKDAVYARAGASAAVVRGPPSVKYRGLFINDEDELTKWSEGRFPQSERHSETYFTSEFYSLVFELILRLKGNYLWPGMKNEAAFYADDPQNGPVADMYGVVMGTSHHEPMALSFDEQNTLLDGPWDWSRNSEEITEFLRNGTKRAKDWETLWTMGMRGEGDHESPTLTADQLEEIIRVQQEILKEEVGDDLDEIPHLWVLYKEVGKYWQDGMDVGEDVTLMWTDDNFGNIQRTPLENETHRIGGHGMYYHFGYRGAPRSYEWISTVQMVKSWEQMHLAYEHGEKQIWIANVQDIKPHELSAEHFLAMGYDMSQFQTPESTTEWLQAWALRNFAEDKDAPVPSTLAADVAEIVNTYGRLVLRRKYGTVNMRPFALSTLHYDEALTVLREWHALADLAQATHDALPEPLRDPFWLLFVHPALAGTWHFETYIASEVGRLYRQQGRASTNAWSWRSMEAFRHDEDAEDRYQSLLGGQWDYFVSHIRMGQGDGPPYGSRNYLPDLRWVDDDDVAEGDTVGVAIAGTNHTSVNIDDEETLVLRSIDRYAPEAEVAYVDVFSAANGTFGYALASNSSFLTVKSNASGTLESPGPGADVRCELVVDWDEAPDGHSVALLTLTTSDDNSDDDDDDETTTLAEVLVPINNHDLPSDAKGFVESNGAIAIPPDGYASAGRSDDDDDGDDDDDSGVRYVNIPWYGKTSSGVKLWPADAPSQEVPGGPRLTYDFYAFSEAEDASLIVRLGGTLNHDPTRPLRLAYAVDDADPAEVQVLEDYDGGSLPTDWRTAVIRGGWNVTSDVSVSPGQHELNLWLLEPGVVVEKIILHLGGMRNSMLGPPESRRVG